MVSFETEAPTVIRQVATKPNVALRSRQSAILDRLAISANAGGEEGMRKKTAGRHVSNTFRPPPRPPRHPVSMAPRAAGGIAFARRAGGVESVRRQMRVLLLALGRDIREKQAELKRLKGEERTLERFIHAVSRGELVRT
jgi:hypothetical protein